MKPILVHCHIYYPEMWAELRECIHNIEPHPFELFATMVEEHSSIQQDILTHFPNAHIEIVENRGYDVGPFIHTINQVNLDNYSYIVKLHTKRDMDVNKPSFRGMTGSKWRDALLSFIKTPEIFNQYIEVFDKNPLIGMQAAHTVIVHHDFYDEKTQKRMRQYLRSNHYPKYKYAFIAGTMFIARSSIFKDIQNLYLTPEDFPDPKGKHETQFAHIMERLFGYIVYKNNMIVRDGLLSIKEETKYHKEMYIKEKSDYTTEIFRFFFQKKITKSGKLCIKICKIPVYSRRRKND